MPDTRVLLIGMMGAGKTTVGHALSGLTGWRYVDNDELVARATGVETVELFENYGPEAMRDAESAALAVAASEPPPVIASVAGGIVERPDDRKRLRGAGFVVWLRARIETLAVRVGTGKGRAWLQPDPEGALRKLYDGRAEFYREVASLVVDVDEIPPQATAERILDALRAP